MTRYTVHIRYLNQFEDVLVDARDEASAIRKARKLSTFTARQLSWSNFVL